MPNPPSVQVVTVASTSPLKVQERVGGQWIGAHVANGSLYSPAAGDSVVAVFDGSQYQLLGKRTGTTSVKAIEAMFTTKGQVIVGTGDGTGTLAGPVTVSSSAGAPSSETWAKGAQYLDSADVLWTCTEAGTPGTWKATPGPQPFSVANAAVGTYGTGQPLLLVVGAHAGKTTQFGNLAVTFPTPFPNGIVDCWLRMRNTPASYVESVMLNTGELTASGFTCSVWQAASGTAYAQLGTATVVISYLAIGF